MRVLSTFSGVGGMDLGLERAGMEVVMQCESEDWKRWVLANHWPNVPCAEDVKQLGKSANHPLYGNRNAVALPAADLLCGGFPCQDLSHAGARAGLAGGRSGLFYEFARIADELRPRWLLLENVPGLLTSDGGRDFGIVLGTLADIGYSIGWRVLDARYFGVPQRRRRVFLVGHLGGDDRSALRALCESCGGDPGSQRDPEADAAARVGAGTTGNRRALNGPFGEQVSHSLTTSASRFDPDGQTYVAASEVAATLTAGSHSPGVSAPGRRKEDDVNLAISTGFHMIQDPISLVEGTPPLGAKTSGMGVASTLLTQTGRNQVEANYVVAPPADGFVRRLTPVECERLMGWPDGWTAGLSDTKRYHACGDGVVANVAEWIGRRIMAIDSE